MSAELRQAGKRKILMTALLPGLAVYLLLISAQFLAAEFSGMPRPGALQWATRLDPLNAEYADKRGAYELRVQQSPATALHWFRKATALNPNRAGYWLDRAVAESALGDAVGQRESMLQVAKSEPHSAGLAWELGNLYLLLGDTESALHEYRAVMQNNPPLAPQAIAMCWKSRPDVNFLLQNVVPENADEDFLSFLMTRNQAEAAGAVWDRIASMQRPVDRPFLFDYIRYLLANRQPVEAARAWQQAGSLSSLEAYQPSEENLVVNGDFSLEILNGGFDWQYHKSPLVTLALDPIDSHSGTRSLRIFFEGPGITDAGIRQNILVDPGTQYAFSAYYKSQDMDGAGGPRFAIQDLYDQTAIFMSDDLRQTDLWTPVEGTFTTGPDTHMVVLRIARVPEGSPIRGKLWIDDLKLVTAEHMASTKREQP